MSHSNVQAPILASRARRAGTAAGRPALWVGVVGVVGGLVWIAAALVFNLGFSWLAVALGALTVGAWTLVWGRRAARQRWPLLVAGQWLSIALVATITLIAEGAHLGWPTLSWSGVLAAFLLAFWMVPVAMLATSRRG